MFTNLAILGASHCILYIYIYTAKNVAPAPSGEHESGFAGPALCEGLGDLGGSTRHRFPRHGGIYVDLPLGK